MQKKRFRQRFLSSRRKRLRSFRRKKLATLATDHKERIAHCQQFIELSKQLETMANSKVAAGQGTKIAVVQAKAARLQAEVDLLREQAKAR